MYKLGDKVVYPHHGAGVVVKKETRTVLGEEREYLTIQILHNDMTVNVPSENAERVGLRKVIDEDLVTKVLEVLHGDGTKMPKNWNRRFKYNRDKMKTGDIFELAEVVRNLSLRDQEKGLSTGEKQMFVKAKKILASELMYAKGMDEDEAAAWLDETLGVVHAPVGRGARRRRRVLGRAWLSRASGRSSSRRAAASASGARTRRPSRSSPARPLLAESLERLDASDWIEGIVVVAPPEWEEPAILLAEEIGAGKVSAAVTGGETRSDSVRAGLVDVPADAAVVLVHDAARPLLSEEVVERVLAPLGEGWDGAVPGPGGGGHAQALRRVRRCRRDGRPGRAPLGADAAGVRRRHVPPRARRRRRRDGLRGLRRARRRPCPPGRGRRAAPEGDDRGRPRRSSRPCSRPSAGSPATLCRSTRRSDFREGWESRAGRCSTSALRRC